MTLSSPVVLNCLPTSRRLLSAILFLPGPITLTCARNIPFPPGIQFPFRNCGLILFLWCHRKIPLCMSSLWFRCAPKPVFPLWCPNMSALPTPLSVTLIPAWKFLLQIPICGTVKINSWSGFLFRIWIVPWGLSTGNPTRILWFPMSAGRLWKRGKLLNNFSFFLK